MGGGKVWRLASSVRWYSSVSLMPQPIGTWFHWYVHLLHLYHTFLTCYSETTLVHGPEGTFVGEDELGNRYYENNNNQIGKQRGLQTFIS